MTIRYSAVGSSAGIAAFTGQHADFGASDVPLTGTEQAAAHGGTSVQVPVDLGAEVVVYHLGIPGAGRLHLTGPAGWRTSRSCGRGARRMLSSDTAAVVGSTSRA